MHADEPQHQIFFGPYDGAWVSWDNADCCCESGHGLLAVYHRRENGDYVYVGTKRAGDVKVIHPAEG